MDVFALPRPSEERNRFSESVEFVSLLRKIRKRKPTRTPPFEFGSMYHGLLREIRISNVARYDK